MAGSRLTPLQRKAVELVMSKARFYIDMRQQQVARVNPRIDQVWDDVVWQQMSNLRNSVSGDKAYGPIRFQVAETMLGDDERKFYDLFSLKSQYCLLGEIVEEKESDSQRTRGILEIHDMRSLFKAIDPTIESLVTLVQTFIWWDLEDAVLVARVDWKADRVRDFQQKGITEEMAAYYQEMAQMDHRPNAEEVIAHELKMIDRSIAQFRVRRADEPGHQIIIRRETTAAENPDLIVEAMASQIGLVRIIESGEELEEPLVEQLAGAMHCEKAKVTPERAKSFLQSTIAANRKKLRKCLAGGGSGEPHNLKRRQLEELEERYKKLSGQDEAPAGE